MYVQLSQARGPSMAENENFVETIDNTTPVDHSPIELHQCKGKILVWSADDVKLLRVTHHIVGALVGSLPRSPRQNAQLSLPLQLMPEEAAVLIEYGVAKMVNVKIKTPSLDDVTAFNKRRQRSFEEQKALLDAENMKRKQDFSHVVALGQMTKKQRRAERAKKLKREKAGLSADSNEDCGDKMADDDKPDAVAMETRDSEETSLVNISKQSYFNFHDKIATEAVPSNPVTLTCMDSSLPNSFTRSASNSVVTSHTSEIHPAKGDKSESMQAPETDSKPVTLTCMDSLPKSSNYSPAKPGATAHTSKIHPAERDKFKNQCAPDTSPVESRTSPENYIEIEDFGQKKEPGKKSCSEMENVSTEGDDKCSNSHGSSDLRLQKTTLREELSRPETQNCVQQSVLETINQSHPVTVTHDSGSPSETENDQTVKNEEQKSVLLAVEEASSNVFKKPSNPLPPSAYLVQLVTASPDTIKQEVTEWAFPTTQRERLRYSVFRDLWETGYYITSGCKFGGDFLVYPEDPFLFHSDFVAICLPHDKIMSPLDVIAYGRLGTNVKKTVVLCSLDESGKVVYTSIQWTGIS